MVSTKLFLTASILITVLLSTSGGVDLLSQVPRKEVLRSERDNGSLREEVGFIMNLGRPYEELLIMGMYTVYDENTKTLTMYTTLRNGYQTSFSIKLLKSSVG